MIAYYVFPGIKSTPAYRTLNGRKIMDPDYVVDTICEYFKVSENELSVKSRRIETVYRRQVTMYFLRKYTLCSLGSIGHRLGGRDHTTVIHSLQSLQNALDTDDRINTQVSDIEKRILRSVFQ